MPKHSEKDRPTRLKVCSDCGDYFGAENSLMGDEGQCQNCWEAESSRGWWLEMIALNKLEVSNDHS